MREIKFSEISNVVTATANNKVNEQFVKDLIFAFQCYPISVDMRYKQVEGRLVISLVFTYANRKRQHFEGGGDSDLITALLMAMQRDSKMLAEYKPEEHNVETAEEGENLVKETFIQYFCKSKMKSYIDTDWINQQGERCRRIVFSPAFNMNIKFCLKATDDIDKIIEEGCKPKNTADSAN